MEPPKGSDRQYTNDDITVVWKPDQCIHSKICWKGLFEVFNPKLRPWVNMSGAESERIAEHVDRCPSGALSWYKNDVSVETAPEVHSETVVEVSANGPLLVWGNITIKHPDGTEEQKHKVTAFCRCGASGNKPYCDGSHTKTGFRDV
jgi:uncharacterized Fe-S cluster protein YjdI